MSVGLPFEKLRLKLAIEDRKKNLTHFLHTFTTRHNAGYTTKNLLRTETQ
jgi:hypothetical protein